MSQIKLSQLQLDEKKKWRKWHVWCVYIWWWYEYYGCAHLKRRRKLVVVVPIARISIKWTNFRICEIVNVHIIIWKGCLRHFYDSFLNWLHNGHCTWKLKPFISMFKAHHIFRWRHDAISALLRFFFCHDNWTAATMSNVITNRVGSSKLWNSGKLLIQTKFFCFFFLPWNCWLHMFYQTSSIYCLTKHKCVIP